MSDEKLYKYSNEKYDFSDDTIFLVKFLMKLVFFVVASDKMAFSDEYEYALMAWRFF